MVEKQSHIKTKTIEDFRAFPGTVPISSLEEKEPSYLNILINNFFCTNSETIFLSNVTGSR